MIRLGIVGTDHIAQRMIACVAQMPGVRVTAIATTSQGSAAPLAQPIGATVCSDAAELAARRDVDAVYVANANPHHAAATRAAIAARKPVLVQKPIALSPEESAQVVAAARQANVLMVENMWCLALPAAQALIERADARTLGTPLIFTLDFGYPVKPELYPALFSAELGVLRDRAAYGVAFARRILGPVVDSSAQVTWLGSVDTSAMISLRHASGAMSTLGFSFDALLSNKASLSCTGGIFHLSPSLGSVQLASEAAAVQIGPLTKRPPRRIRSFPVSKVLKRWRRAPKPEKMPYGSDMHLPMLRHFIALVEAGQTESTLVPLDLSIDAQNLVENMRARFTKAA